MSESSFRSVCFMSEFFLGRNRATGMCMGVDGSPGTDQDNVESQYCEYNIPNSDQVWSYDRYGRVVSRPGAMCLDVHGFRNTTDGQNIHLFTCHPPDKNDTDHVWYMDYHFGTNFFRIKNIYTGKCVDVLGQADPTNGTNIQQYECHAYDNEDADQWWEKVPVSY